MQWSSPETAPLYPPAITRLSLTKIAPTDGAEIYVTDFPCLQCTKSLLQAGIKKIYYMRNYHNDDYAIRLLKRKKVAVEQVKVEPKYLNTVSINIAEN